MTETIETIAFPLSFVPASKAVDLLARIANDLASPHQGEAAAAVKEWRSALATPTQLEAAETFNDDLSIDSHGACISEGENGYFIQSWSWIARKDEDGEPVFDIGDRVILLKETAGLADDAGQEVTLPIGTVGEVADIRACGNPDGPQGPWLYDVEFACEAMGKPDMAWLIYDASDVHEVRRA